MSIFKIGRIGTKEIAVEEAKNARAACYKAGWAPEQCEVSDITDQVIVLSENEEIKLYQTRGLNPRVRANGGACASPHLKTPRVFGRLKRRDLH